MKKKLLKLGLVIAFFTPSIITTIVVLENNKSTNKISNSKENQDVSKTSHAEVDTSPHNTIQNKKPKNQNVVVSMNEQFTVHFSTTRDIHFINGSDEDGIPTITIPKNYDISFEKIKSLIQIKNATNQRLEPIFNYLSSTPFTTSTLSSYEFTVAVANISKSTNIKINIIDEIANFKKKYGNSSIKELLNGSIVLNENKSYYEDSAKKRIKSDFYLPYGITKIANSTFLNVEFLPNDFSLPNSIKSIGSKVFFWLKQLPSDFRLPTKLESIGEYSFPGILSLPNGFAFPSSLKRLEYGTFCFHLNPDQKLFSASGVPLDINLSIDNLSNVIQNAIINEKGVYIGNIDGSTPNYFPLNLSYKDLQDAIRDTISKFPNEIKLNDGISNSPLKGRTYSNIYNMWQIIINEDISQKSKSELVNIKSNLDYLIEMCTDYNNDVKKLNNGQIFLGFSTNDELRNWIVKNAHHEDKNGYHFTDFLKIEELYNFGAKLYSDVDYSSGIKLIQPWDKIGFKLYGSIISIKPMSWKHVIPLAVLKKANINDLIIKITFNTIKVSILSN